MKHYKSISGTTVFQMHTCEICSRQFTYKALWSHKRNKHACIPQGKMIQLHQAFHTILKMADTITTKDPSKEERLHGLLSGIKNIMDDHTFSNHTRLIGYREFGRERVGEYMSELKKIINKKNDFFLSFIKTVYCDPSYPENIKISSLDGRFCKVVVNPNHLQNL